MILSYVAGAEVLGYVYVLGFQVFSFLIDFLLWLVPFWVLIVVGPSGCHSMSRGILSLLCFFFLRL